MGSFNASCAVSHCSINPGDEVKLIAIVSNNPIHDRYTSEMHKGFACYCYENFSIIGYPMDATYEDYGNFEVKKNTISDFNLSIIRQNYTQNIKPPKDEDDDYEYESSRDGYNLTADQLDWDKIGELIHFGNMYLDSNQDRTKRRYMGFFPVHKCVYDLLMQRSPEMYFNETYGNVSFKQYFEYQLENNKRSDNTELDEQIAHYMEMFSPTIGKLDKEGNLITPELVLEKATTMAEYRIESMNYRHRKEYSYKDSTQIWEVTRYLKDTKQPEMNDAEYEDLIKIDAETLFLIRGLNDFQISIVPPMTAGQEYDKTEHAIFLIATGQALLNSASNYNEDNEGEAHKFKTSAHIEVSLKTLRSDAEEHWNEDKRAKKVDAVDRFLVQYPNGVALTAHEVHEQGYGVILDSIQSTLLPIVFINDNEE